MVAQIALAVLLSAGAGLLLRSVANLRGINPGLDVTAVAVLDATVPTQLDADARRRAYLEALPALQALPGVRAAAATQKLPLRGSGDNWGVSVVGRPDLDGGTTFVRLVTPDYFQALGIPLRKGRGLRGDRSRHDGARRRDQRGACEEVLRGRDPTRPRAADRVRRPRRAHHRRRRQRGGGEPDGCRRPRAVHALRAGARRHRAGDDVRPADGVWRRGARR